MNETKRALHESDIIDQPKVPVSYDIEDPRWAASYPWWNREWTDWETITPRGGFLEDFVLSTKGTETATSFALWTGLTIVASVLARDAKVDLYPAAWYPNLYIILVAPPGLAKKSTTLNLGAKILYTYHEKIIDDNLRFKKKTNLHMNRVTPEGLQDLLLPPPAIPSRREDLPGVYVDRGSQITLFVSELSTFLGRQSYNLGMVAKLTDLYECKDVDADYTKKDGRQILRNIYVNFAAATTPHDLDKVLPEEALGGGLMSRTVVVYESDTQRMHPLPVRMAEGPGLDHLQEGLAWIAKNGYGDYRLSEDALALYYQWYASFKKNLRTYDSVRVLSASRMDSLVLKLATLIRAQRYEPGRQIETSDFTKAVQILEKTYSQNEDAVTNVGATERGRYYNRIEAFLQKNGTVERRRLLTAFSRHLSSEDLTSILAHMHEAGRLRIVRDGHRANEVTRNGKETYTLTKEEYDES